MDSVNAHIAHRIADHLGAEVSSEEVVPALSSPPDTSLGDVAFPCYPFAGRFGIAPHVLASRLGSHFQPDRIIAAVAAHGPYLNFFLSRAPVGSRMLAEVLTQGDGFGRQDIGGGQTIVLDYSSPNIAKPFHFGHLRSTNLGACLARIWETLGFRVWRQNYLGDWGTQFGFVMYAWGKYGDEEQLRRDAVTHLVELYVRAYRESESDAAVREASRDLFRRLEGGDPELVALWRRFRDLSVRSLERTYARLGFVFDSYEGEAAMNGKVGSVLDRLRARGVSRVSEGATVVDVEDVLGRPSPPCMLCKSDGATTYAARDCAAAIDRWERHQFAANVYVCARQEDHFAQVFAALKKLGESEGWAESWPDRCENVSFGFVRGMSTRTGTAVWLDDVLDEARDRAAALRERKRAEQPEALEELTPEQLEAVAESVGQAAVLYFDVSNRRMTDLTFDWDEVLRLEGNTGPYLQYTHARICGIYRKAGVDAHAMRSTASGGALDLALLFGPAEEWELLKALGRFRHTLRTAADRREPSEVADYLFHLASIFNRFYFRERVLNPGDPELTRQRLMLVEATRTVLASGLGILGIRPLEVM